MPVIPRGRLVELKSKRKGLRFVENGLDLASGDQELLLLRALGSPAPSLSLWFCCTRAPPQDLLQARMCMRRLVTTSHHWTSLLRKGKYSSAWWPRR